MGERMNERAPQCIEARECEPAEQSERPHQVDEHCHNQQGDRHQSGPNLFSSGDGQFQHPETKEFRDGQEFFTQQDISNGFHERLVYFVPELVGGGMLIPCEKRNPAV